MKLHLGIILFIATLTSKAEDYVGAGAVLKLLAEKAQAQPAAEKKADPVEELRLMVKALRTESAALAPAEAAKRWLALLDAYLTIPAQQLYTRRAAEDRLSMSTILMALPPPAAWEEIRAQLEKRKTSKPLQDESLRLLAAALLGDIADEKACLERMNKELISLKKLERYQRERYQQNIHYITETLEDLTGTDIDKIAIFEKNLSQLEKGERGRLAGSSGIPDLVKIVGEKRAEALLSRVLKLDSVYLQISGTATQKLAAALALKQMDSLKLPHWELVHSLDDAPLYEALKKKFPQEDRGGRERMAQHIYLLALIASGRTEDATQLFQGETGWRDDGNERPFNVNELDALDELNAAGLGAKVLSFLKQLLSKDPGIPCWHQFIELSARQNASVAALEFMEKSLTKPGLSAEAKNQIQSHRYPALLAADKRDEGVLVLRELLKAGPQGDDSRDLNAYIRLCTNQARLGSLLNRPELIEEALSSAVAAYEALPEDGSNRGSILYDLADLLLDHQRGPKAESILAHQIASQVSPDRQQRGRVNMESPLTLLANVYDQAGRHADVLVLLEQSPYWGAADLTAFESHNYGTTPLALIAVRALMAAGRTEEARRVILRLLQVSPGEDRVYELLLQVGAEQPLEELLDQMAKRDRFQERPLIWKARVQLDAGKLDQAEKTARAAIAIDPSDGEQGKGNRMRAYAVLAEVLEKKGDATTAKIMRGAVSAIRKSEAADDWWRAGLLSEAARRYEEALHDFADAYCIQARLALRYSETGDLTKAEQHYVRAFELMPDSFGRIESHCFGCEGAFSSLQAQSAADKVFSHLAAVPPVKAQVHYLLGYLRKSQGRTADAAAAYRLAVKTDPDYLNAWKEFASLPDGVGISPAERENAALQMFRLDPAGNHSNPNFSHLVDLRRLWGALLDAEKNLPKTETGPLLSLTASKAKIEAQKADGTEDPFNDTAGLAGSPKPRERLVEHPIIRILAGLIDNMGRF